MNTRRLRICTAMAGLLLLTATAAWSAESSWILLDSDASSDFYYDKGSISRSPEGIIDIWARVSYTEDGRQEVLDMLKNEAYRKLAYSLYNYEINCAAGQSRLNQVIHYDAKGDKIAEFALAGKTSWEPIPIASRLDQVVEQECPEK